MMMMMYHIILCVQTRLHSEVLSDYIDYCHYYVVSSSWTFKSSDAVSTCLCLYMCFVYFYIIFLYFICKRNS